MSFLEGIEPSDLDIGRAIQSSTTEVLEIPVGPLVRSTLVLPLTRYLTLSSNNWGWKMDVFGRIVSVEFLSMDYGVVKARPYSNILQATATRKWTTKTWRTFSFPVTILLGQIPTRPFRTEPSQANGAPRMDRIDV